MLSEQTVKFLACWFILTLLFHTAKGALRVCSVCLPLLLFLVSPVLTFLVIWNFIFLLMYFVQYSVILDDLLIAFWSAIPKRYLYQVFWCTVVHIVCTYLKYWPKFPHTVHAGTSVLSCNYRTSNWCSFVLQMMILEGLILKG